MQTLSNRSIQRKTAGFPMQLMQEQIKNQNTEVDERVPKESIGGGVELSYQTSLFEVDPYSMVQTPQRRPSINSDQ